MELGLSLDGYTGVDLSIGFMYALMMLIGLWRGFRVYLLSVLATVVFVPAVFLQGDYVAARVVPRIWPDLEGFAVPLLAYFMVLVEAIAIAVALRAVILRLVPEALVLALNRPAGALLGIVRGTMLGALACLASAFAPAGLAAPVWNDSRLLPVFGAIARQISELAGTDPGAGLLATFAARLAFDEQTNQPVFDLGLADLLGDAARLPVDGLAGNDDSPPAEGGKGAAEQLFENLAGNDDSQPAEVDEGAAPRLIDILAGDDANPPVQVGEVGDEQQPESPSGDEASTPGELDDSVIEQLIEILSRDEVSASGEVDDSVIEQLIELLRNFTDSQ